MMSEGEDRRAWFRREVLPHEAVMMRYAARLVRNPSEAEDLVHEAFARLIAFAGWREIASPRAFALSTIHNLVRQTVRRCKVVDIVTLGNLADLPLGDDRPGPDRIAEARAELARLTQAIEGLPPQCRRVFAMCKIDGLSHAAIADRLGLSISTVEKHVVKGLRLCSEALARGDDLPWGWHGSKTPDAEPTAPSRGGGDVGRAIGGAGG